MDSQQATGCTPRMKAAPQLPPEIILYIIDSVIDDSATIYSPDSDVTKTLLSLTRVCRATYAHASNHLRRQCMYIDDGKRLADCVAYLKATNHLVPEYNDGKIEDAKGASPAARLRPITSLYLALFFDKVDYQQNLTYFVELCTLVAPSLKRLIADIPFWYFSESWNRGDVEASYAFEVQCNPRLYSLLEALSALTELKDVIWIRDCWVFDFFFVIGTEGMVMRSFEAPDKSKLIFPWRLWPNLQRLALHRVHLDRVFWHSVRTAEKVDTLIVVSPTWIHGLSHKTAFLQSTPTVDPESSVFGRRTLESPRSINIVIVPLLSDRVKDLARQRLLVDAPQWPVIDPDKLIKFRLCQPPVSLPPEDCGVGSKESVNEYVRNAALRGEIWNWKGEAIG